MIEISASVIVWAVSFIICMAYALTEIKKNKGTYFELVIATIISLIPFINTTFSLIIVFSWVSDTGILEKQVFKD